MKIYSLSKLNVYNTVLLSTITVPCISFPRLIYLLVDSLILGYRIFSLHFCTRFLNLSTINIWGNRTLCFWGHPVLCLVGCLAASLGSSHLMPGSPTPPVVTPKMSPDSVTWGRASQPRLDTALVTGSQLQGSQVQLVIKFQTLCVYVTNPRANGGHLQASPTGLCEFSRAQTHVASSSGPDTESAEDFCWMNEISQWWLHKNSF